MKRKITLLLVLMVMCLGLTGCAKEEVKEEKKEKQTTENNDSFDAFRDSIAKKKAEAPAPAAEPDYDITFETIDNPTWDPAYLTEECVLQDIKYYAPSNWDSSDATITGQEGYYYYPQDGTIALIYICSSVVDGLGDYDLTDRTVANEMYDQVMQGLTGGTEFKDNISTDYITIAGLPAATTTYTDDGFEYVAYIFGKDNYIYSLVVGEETALSDNLLNYAEAFVSLISVNDGSTASLDNGGQTTTSNTSPADLSGSQKEAYETAQSYLKYMNFSYSELVDQLEYEGYSNADATAAVDACNVDWYLQAEEKAVSYLNYSAFSYDGLIEMLEFQGFTSDQATKAVDKCGADWNEQAVKCAESYLEYSTFTKEELIDQLEYEGFTPAQAKYGVEGAGL